ncbi:hypothetical protein FRC09_009566, partial [Ceratobasidium sp. 395]
MDYDPFGSIRPGPTVLRQATVLRSSEGSRAASEGSAFYNPIVKSGEVSVKEGGLTGWIWSRRWMVLKEQTLSFHKNETASSSTLLWLQDISTIKRTDLKRYCLFIAAKDKKLFLSLKSDLELYAWRDEIRDRTPGTKVVMSMKYPELVAEQRGAQNRVDGRDQLKTTSEQEADITSAMAPEEIALRLSLRGYADMTEQLDLPTCSNRPISSGGYGDIFQGCLKTGTKVAIKTIRLYVGTSEQDQKILKHAAHEIYAWSKCKHPNVQPLLGIAMFREQIGMITQWESNGNMTHYLDRQTDTDRCALSTQIANGLSYLHSLGVVHGDLKGANVLISQDGIAQLADFGNARLQQYSLKFTKTTTKASMSLRWAAPELYRNDPCTYATDVFALGMEAVTGDVPWSGIREEAIMFSVSIKQACPERPETYIPATSEHGDTLWSLLKLCWEFKPEERPSAISVARAMKGVTQNGLKP